LGFKKSEITLDVKRMQQVFLNLVSNAVKFTDREGKIKIQVIKQQKHIKVSVTDNGLGIKEQDKDKLFKLFGSIKSEKKKINTNGIGLGLVISKLITNKYGGEIDFDSEYKKGSTFWFTFEVEDDKSGPQEIVHPKRRSSLDLKKGVARLKSSEVLSGVKVTPQNYQLIMANVEKFQKFSNLRILVVDDEEFCLSSTKAIMRSIGFDIDYQIDFCI